MNITKKLQENQAILVLLNSKTYNNDTIEITKKLAKDSICYVTLNKTSFAVRETLQKKKVNLDNIVFIDAISKTITDKPPQDKDCYYVQAPNALMELSLTISKFLKHNFSYLIFDSLTNLLIYQKKAPIAKFTSSLINKIKASKTKAVFFALDIAEHEEFIQEVSIFVDEVVRL